MEEIYFIFGQIIGSVIGAFLLIWLGTWVYLKSGGKQITSSVIKKMAVWAVVIGVVVAASDMIFPNWR